MAFRGDEAAAGPASDSENPVRTVAGILRSDERLGDLESIDRKLIDLLQADGRTPYAELARQIGVTEKTVRRRVNHLLDASYIQISAVADPSMLGLRTLALVLVRADGSRSPSDIADELALLPAVDYITVTTGPFALQAEVLCADGSELDDVVALIRGLSGVGQVEILPYLRLHFQHARFAGPRLPENGVRPRAFDEMDREITSHLAVDGRASFRALADLVGISETAVRQRYTRLTDSNAVRVMCIVNPLRYGYRATCWVGLRLAAGGRADDVAEALTGLHSVSYVAITAGYFDVLAEVVAASGEDLLAVLDDEIRPLAGVESIETWLYLDLRYKALQPRLRVEGRVHANDIQTV
jgi:DNA-binding Lrp family transcriptional regulator